MLKIIKRNKYIISFIIILIIICLVVIRSKTLKEENIEYLSNELDNNELYDKKENTIDDSLELKEETIKVDIKGQVINPGVFELELGSRVIDLINA